MLQRISKGKDGLSCACYSVLHLTPVLYPSFSSQGQQTLLHLYDKIASDSSPQIRKQASAVLNSLIKLGPKVPETDLLSLFIKLN